MDIVIYGGAHAPRTAVVARSKAKLRKSLFARFMESLRETRRLQADREIARYAHLMASEPRCKADRQEAQQ